MRLGFNLPQLGPAAPEKRHVIELRFFAGLMPRTIALRLGLPVETIKTRLKRALADLRGTLEDSEGGRWPVVFALSFGMTPRTLAAHAPSTLFGAMGVLSMSKALTFSIVAVLLLLGALALWWHSDVPPSHDVVVSEESAPAAADPLDGAVNVAEVPGLIGSEGSERLPPPDGSTGPSANAPSATNVGTKTISGTVVTVDDDGLEHPVSSGTLRFRRMAGGGPLPEGAWKVPIRQGRRTNIW